MSEIWQLRDIPEEVIFPSDIIIEGKHGKVKKGYVVQSGTGIVHRGTENLNAIIARSRGEYGKPGHPPSKKLERKRKANRK